MRRRPDVYGAKGAVGGKEEKSQESSPALAFHNPFDVASSQQIGSNDDPTGNNTTGLRTVAFRRNWARAADLARSNVPGLELVEVA